MSLGLQQLGKPRAGRTLQNRIFLAICIVVALTTLGTLAVLLSSIFYQGVGNLWGIDREAHRERLEDIASEEAWAVVDQRLAGVAPDEWPALRDENDLESFLAGEPADVVDEILQDLFADRWGELRASLENSFGPEWMSISVEVPLSTRIHAWFDSIRAVRFLTTPPSRRAEDAGLEPALWGTIWICAVCGLTALPIGVGTAVFLEEFKPKSRRLRRAHAFVELNIRNLAGVPSIVYGIIGLTAFVQMFAFFGVANEPIYTFGTRDDWWYLQLPFGRSTLAGGLTLMLVVLPIVIIASQEALRAVPDSIRQGALAVGCTRWQVVSKMTLPAAIPGIMTGSILAMSRAIGEAAPILVIAGIVFVRFTPENLMDDFTAMPLQIYNWAGRPQEEFHRVAASGIIILLAVLLSFNALAVFIRQKLQKPLQ